MVVHGCNSGKWEVEARESMEVTHSYRGVEASTGYVRPCLKRGKKSVELSFWSGHIAW